MRRAARLAQLSPLGRVVLRALPAIALVGPLMVSVPTYFETDSMLIAGAVHLVFVIGPGLGYLSKPSPNEVSKQLDSTT